MQRKEQMRLGLLCAMSESSRTTKVGGVLGAEEADRDSRCLSVLGKLLSQAQLSTPSKKTTFQNCSKAEILSGR